MCGNRVDKRERCKGCWQTVTLHERDEQRSNSHRSIFNRKSQMSLHKGRSDFQWSNSHILLQFSEVNVYVPSNTNYSMNMITFEMISESGSTRAQSTKLLLGFLFFWCLAAVIRLLRSHLCHIVPPPHVFLPVKSLTRSIHCMISGKKTERERL